MWVYRDRGFRPEILGPSVGCGITLFVTAALDVDEALLRAFTLWVGNSRIHLGGGEHFISLCTRHPLAPDSQLLAIHMHDVGGRVPLSFQEALERQQRACDQRQAIGERLLHELGISGAYLEDHPHNTVVREEGRTIYAKGAIRVAPTASIALLALNPRDGFYFYGSYWRRFGGYMQHCTGRPGPAKRATTLHCPTVTYQSVTGLLVSGMSQPTALPHDDVLKAFIAEQSCVGFASTKLLVRPT